MPRRYGAAGLGERLRPVSDRFEFELSGQPGQQYPMVEKMVGEWVLDIGATP
jgi:hypothetical protein